MDLPYYDSQASLNFQTLSMELLTDQWAYEPHASASLFHSTEDEFCRENTTETNTSLNLPVEEWQGMEWAMSGRGVSHPEPELWGLENSSGPSQEFCPLAADYSSTLLHEEMQQLLNTNSMDQLDYSSSTTLEASLSPLHFDECSGQSLVEEPTMDSSFVNTEEYHNDWNHDLDDLCTIIGNESDVNDTRSHQELPENHEDLLQKIPSKRRKRVRSPKIWEFLIRLLADSRTNPSLVRWEDKSMATFRLVKPDLIASLWSQRTPDSQPLCYNNFARGLRYHYNKGALEPVSERQLVYKCGPKALQFLLDISQGNA